MGRSRLKPTPNRRFQLNFSVLPGIRHNGVALREQFGPLGSLVKKQKCSLVWIPLDWVVVGPNCCLALRFGVLFEMRKLRRDRHPYRSAAISVAASPPAPPFSSRNLDFVSLALCSCALTLLCHSAAHVPSVGSASNGSLAASSRPLQNLGSSLQAFTLPSFRPSVESDEAQEP